MDLNAVRMLVQVAEARSFTLAAGQLGISQSGSLALEGFRPDDAFLVKRLRAAGALILGKTNLSEWANFRSSQSVSGWSARGGQTRNPYRLSHSPCGSSSGSAVAVSANLAVAAIGTETDGSIVCPAARRTGGAGDDGGSADGAAHDGARR